MTASFHCIWMNKLFSFWSSVLEPNNIENRSCSLIIFECHYVVLTLMPEEMSCWQNLVRGSQYTFHIQFHRGSRSAKPACLETEGDTASGLSNLLLTHNPQGSCTNTSFVKWESLLCRKQVQFNFIQKNILDSDCGCWRVRWTKNEQNKMANITKVHTPLNESTAMDSKHNGLLFTQQLWMTNTIVTGE